MQIQSDNFLESLPKVLASISAATFISFDLEFSGLRYRQDSYPRTSMVDSNQAIYERWSMVAEHFQPFQIGISCFAYNATKGILEESTYSFLLHPKGKTFLCQADCLSFLSKHKFNFNECFKKGLVCEKVAGDIETEMMKGGDDWITTVSKALRAKEEKHARLADKIKAVHWSKQTKAAGDSLVQEVEQLIATNEFGEEKTIEVSDTGLLAYIRSVLNKKQFAAAELVFGQHSLIIRKKLFEAAGEVIGLQDAVDSEVDEKQWHLAYLAERLGFSLVFLEMVRSKKPVVGHFCIFDWMYVYSSCYAPMPKKVDDFFKGLRRLFPSTFDTKVLCQYAKAFDKKLQSGLGKLYSYMRDNAPKQLRLIEIEEFSEELKHDAGYDSSITGFSFVYLCMIILNKCSLDKLKEDCKKSLDFHSWPDGSEMYLNAERVVEYYSDEAIKTGGADPKDISKLIVCRWTPHSGTKEEEIKMIDELAEVVSDSYSFQLHRINKSNFYLEIKSSEQLDLPPLIAQLNEKFQTRIRFSDYDHPLIEDIDRFWISRMGHV